MQKWEHAHIDLYFSSQNTYITIRYLHADGSRSGDKVEKGGFFSKDPDFWGTLYSWIHKLGQEGYEMVGYSSYGVGFTASHSYWFKHPL